MTHLLHMALQSKVRQEVLEAVAALRGGVREGVRALIESMTHQMADHTQVVLHHHVTHATLQNKAYCYSPTTIFLIKNLNNIFLKMFYYYPSSAEKELEFSKATYEYKMVHFSYCYLLRHYFITNIIF